MFYIQVDSNNLIRDCIDYAHPGYIPAPSLTVPLPESINAAWYRWVGGAAVLDTVVKQAAVSTQVAKAKEEGREEIRVIVRGAAGMPTIGLEAKTELKNKGVLPASF